MGRARGQSQSVTTDSFSRVFGARHGGVPQPAPRQLHVAPLSGPNETNAVLDFTFDPQPDGKLTLNWQFANPSAIALKEYTGALTVDRDGLTQFTRALQAVTNVVSSGQRELTDEIWDESNPQPPARTNSALLHLPGYSHVAIHHTASGQADAPRHSATVLLYKDAAAGTERSETYLNLEANALHDLLDALRAWQEKL